MDVQPKVPGPAEPAHPAGPGQPAGPAKPAPPSLPEVRHALRTPINHILGYCELLREDPELPESFKTDLDKINAGGRQLLAVISEYFDETRPSARAKDLRQLDHELRTPVNHIIGYSELLQEQALEMNRTEFIPELEKIQHAARAWLALMERNRTAIPSQFQASSPKPAPNESRARSSSSPRLALEPGAILLVDDDRDNRDLSARRLQHYGYTVAVAANGPEALRLIQAQHFDLVLLDLIMPQMNGLEILGRIRKKLSMTELPVIMLTAKDSNLDVIEALKLGANDYLTKPTEFAVVLARTQTHLKLKKGQEQLKGRMQEIKKLAAELEKRNDFIKRIFGRYVTDDVVQNLLQSPEGLKLGGEKRRVTILMSDLRGFTAIAERLPPEKVVEMLNVYLAAMTDIITRYHGLIDEFIGDAILAIFGAPIRSDDHAENAVACALAMQLAMAQVNQQMQSLGVPPLEMGIGINTGYAVIGNIGSSKRAKYAVVGSQVNLASRIQAATVGGQIFISEATAAFLRPILSVNGTFTIAGKGLREPMLAYSVNGLKGSYNLALHEPEEEFGILPKPVAVECFAANEQKQFSGPAFAGQITRLSKRKAVLAGPPALAPGTDLKLHFSGLPDELLAKVTHSPSPGDPGSIIVFTYVPACVNELFETLRQPAGC